MATLTEEQKNVVRQLVKNRNKDQIQTLGGYAGTGKTTVMGTLAEVLTTYAICAYTGKAANVLRKKGMTASTIHSLIYKPMISPDGKIEFWLKEPHELGYEGFLVDEASMVSKEIYEDLLTFDLPIIFVGDHGQLEPVGSAINVMKDPQYRLETVHRNAGEIAHFAEHLRKGGLARTFTTDHKVQFVDPKEITDEMMAEAGQMICAYNKSRVEKNERVRAYLKREALVEVGERVMCLRNNKRQGLFNGMQGEVKKLHKKHPKFDFWSDGVTYVDIMFDANQFGKEKNQFEFGSDSPNPFDYAYCITCHKAQGDEWDSVLVFEQVCDKWEHKRWAYTAASRAKGSLTWACPGRTQVFRPSWL
jgi:exodeoxyribonuclease-5